MENVRICVGYWPLGVFLVVLLQLLSSSQQDLGTVLSQISPIDKSNINKTTSSETLKEYNIEVGGVGRERLRESHLLSPSRRTQPKGSFYKSKCQF